MSPSLAKQEQEICRLFRFAQPDNMQLIQVKIDLSQHCAVHLSPSRTNYAGAGPPVLVFTTFLATLLRFPRKKPSSCRITSVLIINNVLGSYVNKTNSLLSLYRLFETMSQSPKPVKSFFTMISIFDVTHQWQLTLSPSPLHNTLCLRLFLPHFSTMIRVRYTCFAPVTR